MHRRVLLAGLGGFVGSMPLLQTAAADERESRISDTIDVTLGHNFEINVATPAILMNRISMNLIQLESGMLSIEEQGQLTAKVRASVKTYTDIEYRLSVALFDRHNTLLGAATRNVAVEYVRLGRMGLTWRDIDLDFGKSKSYAQLARIAVAFNEVDVPRA